MLVVFKMQNLSNGGLNDDCLADMPTDQHWKCVFVPVSHQYSRDSIAKYSVNPLLYIVQCFEGKIMTDPF